MSQKTHWIKVGRVGVDAGLIWIGDPCYVIHKNDGELEKDGLGKDWMGFCDKLQSNEKDLVTDFGILGMAISSGFGDGCYDVYVKYSDEGSWGRRVAEAKIVFID